MSSSFGWPLGASARAGARGSQLITDKEAKTLTLIDRGCGMSKEDLINQLGTPRAAPPTPRHAAAASPPAQISVAHLADRAVGMRGAWQQTESPQHLLRCRLLERELSRRGQRGL